MKARVNTFLNVRTGTPEILQDNNPNDAFYRPGDVVEIIKTFIGQEHKDNNVWYKVDDGGFVWSGGVGPIKQELQVNDWLDFFQLNKINANLSSAIQNIKITLLDTGIDTSHKDLDDVLLNSKNFIFPDRSVMDFDGHGSHCSGILVGNGKQRISGILKGAKINVGKILTTSAAGVGGLDNKILLTALEWAAQQSDVISISAGLIEFNDDVHQLIMHLADNGKIIVASIGNVVGINVDKPNYPAKYPECISVGSLSNDFGFSDFNIPDNNIDICFPGENVISTYLTNKGTYKAMSGTSVATPFIAGIAAILKMKNSEIKIADIRSLLSNYTIIKKIDNFSYKSITNKPIEI